MGNSLSQDSQAILEAATAGDALLLKQQIECEPKLLESVTLVKRRGVLHLAAKQGHPQVISTVLDPLLEAVRQEYHAHMEAEARRRREEQALQQQPQPQPQQAVQPEPDQPHPHQAQEQSQTPSQQQPQRQQQQQGDAPAGQTQQAPSQGSGQSPQADLQLASFQRLRHTVNARDLYRRTPLIVAAKQGHLECAHLLVDAASNLFAVDREGNTSLHYAALHGHSEVVEYLLQRAADRGLGARFVNKRNLSGFTALHYAVWSCRTGVVVPLLAAGADICAVNDRVFDAWVPVPIGSTPLHLAVVRGSVPVALLLLQHYVLSLTSGTRDRPWPADPRTLVNLYGMNPAQLAAHRNNRQMAQLLMPSVSLSRVVPVSTPPPPRVFGPPSLKSIAAAVLQRTLTQRLDNLEADQAQQACGATTSTATCTKASAKDHQAHCSQQVCVQACCSDGSEAGAGAAVLSPLSAGSADVDLIVVQTDVSPGSSRAASPVDVLDAASPAGRGGQSPAASDRGKTVTFSPAASQDKAEGSYNDPSAATSFAEVAASLRHALTSASSSGWYDELCCVCWESEVTAVMEPCMHAMCLGCARQLVGCSGTAAPACPLCRANISGFAAVPHDARQQAGKRKKGLMAGSGI